MRYDPGLYLYASARIRALESRLVGREKLRQLLELPDAEAILEALREHGIPKTDDPLAAPEAALKAAFSAVAESVPDPTLPLFLQYPYDCHNLKVLEKCRVQGSDPAPLLIDLGSIPTETLLTAPEQAWIALLPPHLSQAVGEAREAYAKTGDPREIDFLLDRAAFADMAAAAAPFPLAPEWVAAKADLTNLLICYRILRLYPGELGQTTLRACALHGGSLGTDRLLTWHAEGEDAFLEALSHTPYAGIFEKDAPFSLIERRADDALSHRILGARSESFGAEIPIVYLLAAETQCKNLRILLAGKLAGKDTDTIRSGMRECYV